MNIESAKNKEIHLIKLDIDGTSTNADFSTLNQNLKKVLQKLKEQGHKICFTTGRNYLSALPFYKEVDLDTFLVTYNGAYINNPSDRDNKEIVAFHTIKNNIIRDILNEPAIKKNICNVLIDHVGGLKSDGEVNLKTISTSDDIYYQEIFFNGNPYESTMIKGEITSVSPFVESDNISIWIKDETGKSQNLFYNQKDHGKVELQKGEKYFFVIDHEGSEMKHRIRIKEIKRKSGELLAHVSEQILQLLGKKDVLQLVLEFPKDEKTFNEILLVLRRKYSDAITFYFGSKLKAKSPGDKILVPDPERKIIKIRNELANKRMGAEWIARQYNISLHNVIAFGNDVNDIELVHSVGKGIVTADSNDHLKTYAYGITDYGLLNSDGVAKYLSDYFGLKN